MTTTPALQTSAGISSISQSPQANRIVSLDLFRGITIAMMILVNNPGEATASYWPLEHAKWNGWTPTDLVFPFFVFIVGVAMAFSFTSRLRRGDTRQSLFMHVLWRGLALFAIGVLLNGFPERYNSHLRIYGVLQRIAICYVITAVLELWTDWKAQLAVVFTCLAGYWLLMRFVPVPGFGIPTHDMPILDPDRNIVAWLDRKLLMGHLYETTRDPEGVLSTIPAVASCLTGLLTGKWLRTTRANSRKALAMVACGVCAVILGSVWHLWFPINKKLWTSSFVLLTSGLALLFLALFYWLTDIKNFRKGWTNPILVFGRNAIAAYVFAEILAKITDTVRVHSSFGLVTAQDWVYLRFFAPLSSPANASLLYAITYVCVCWLAMLWFYRKGLFLKI